MLVDESQFFFVRSVGVVPLLVVGEAISERAVAGNLAVGPQAACCHEWYAQINDFSQSASIHAKMQDATALVEGHVISKTQPLFDQISSQLDSEIRGPRRLRPVRQGGTLFREEGKEMIDNAHLPKALHQGNHVLFCFPHAHHEMGAHVGCTEDIQGVLEDLPIFFPPVRRLFCRRPHPSWPPNHLCSEW